MPKVKILFSVLIVFIITGISAEDNNLSINDLKPEPQHQRIIQSVAKILTSVHYKKVAIDDSMSSQLLTNFIDYLDYNKSYFLAEDIEQFENFRYDFDVFLVSGELNPVFVIFNTYQRRIKERLNFIDQRIDKPFDFTINEFYKPYRDSSEWASSKAELDEYWRKRIKNEYLNLKISGKDEDKIKEILHKRYTNLRRRVSQNQSEDVIQIYLNAFARVFDPHTNYFSPKATDDFQIRMKQSLEGIGARLSTENEYTRIMEIISGGPADKSGLLKPNDLIIGVGQDVEGEMVDVIGWRLDDVVQLIRGPKNSIVRLQILHNETQSIADAKTIVITRDKVKLEDSAAKSDLLHLENNGENYTLGVIKIPAFYFDYESKQMGDKNYKSTTRDVEKILNDFKTQDIDGVVIDLRENGGGFLSEAIDLTGLFIKDGPVVQVKDTRGEITINRDNDPRIVYDGPVAVLVDEFSASASEIFAAAIQDYGRGIIIGSQTYGKGTVQSMMDLAQTFRSTSGNLGQVKLTIQKYYRINGGSTQHIGVIPDIELPSRFSHSEVGESSQKNALLWDQIVPAHYSGENGEIESILPSLKQNNSIRMQNNDLFADYQKEIEEYRERRDRKEFSLNEEVRKAERNKNSTEDSSSDDEQEEISDETSGPAQTEDDILLTESANILSDYIQFLKIK
jgi:carboxyl-terminal processing protease